jgi:hypothetical protein
VSAGITPLKAVLSLGAGWILRVGYAALNPTYIHHINNQMEKSVMCEEHSQTQELLLQDLMREIKSLPRVQRYALLDAVRQVNLENKKLDAAKRLFNQLKVFQH